ncbi:unnamed protein product [Polarella glacialis]|uniref:Molybdate-anion transporter n=1 Tax=Polarella glacialis TaxID=89957 RepID=A0A813JJG4_POLGL|nr:unnamed protein product [Polarella glacialis]
MQRMLVLLLVLLLAVGVALGAKEAAVIGAKEAAAVLADDACLWSGGSSTCALQALQRSKDRQGVPGTGSLLAVGKHVANKEALTERTVTHAESGANSSQEQLSLRSFCGQTFYHMMILPLLTVTLLLAYLSRPSASEKLPPDFVKFTVQYLIPWSFCVGADWLQGPYVYSLYEAYGFSKHEIAQLFVAGFASAFAFSFFIGAVADRVGRKKCCLAYCVLYIVSCATKHSNQYRMLMVGRITGGMATAILFSCFECWMVSEHLHRHAFSEQLLSYMFGLKYTVMYFVAIICGIAAQFGADSRVLAPIAAGSHIFTGGDTIPFDMSAAVLLVAVVLIAFSWEDNYGRDASAATGQETGLMQSAMEVLRLMAAQPDVLRLCALISCFEGAMFSFVFNWTPALGNGPVKTPHGLVFALFMMAAMSGASAATLVTSVKPHQKLMMLLTMGILALAMAAMTAMETQSTYACFTSFLVFEFCVGAYYPSVGIMKSQIVPEHVRAAMYTLYRVPLNAIVVCLLLNDFSPKTCFQLCAVLLGFALLATSRISAQKAQRADEAPEDDAPKCSES